MHSPCRPSKSMCVRRSHGSKLKCIPDKAISVDEPEAVAIDS